jgi:Asp-tRNA(Asn)/Glu-tRNA(Gln) amidotransferase A subunit family amidase
VPANDLGLCAVSLPVQHLDPSPAEQGGRAPLPVGLQLMAVRPTDKSAQLTKAPN